MRSSLTLSLGVLALVVGWTLASLAMGQDMSAFTTALDAADTEIRTGIFPAIAGVFGAVVLIGVAGLVVSRIARGN